MKKRIFAMLLALVMVVSILPLAAFAAIECTSNRSPDGFHNWSEKGNWNNKYSQCSYCQKTCSNNGSNGNYKHAYDRENPTGKCTICGMSCSNTNDHNNNRSCNTCGLKSNTHVHSYGTNGKCTGRINGQKCSATCPHTVCSSITGKCKVCSWVCKHDGTANNNVVNGVCTKCGMTVETHKHTYDPAKGTGLCEGENCDEPCQHVNTNGTKAWNATTGKCNICGKACDHQYDVQAGTGTCTTCGKSCNHASTEPIPVVKPTCSQPGTTGGTKCAVCKAIVTPATIVSATGEHNYSVFVSGTDATCDTDGSGTFKCSTCDATEERVIPAGHALDATLVFVNATCANKGVAYFECSRCSHTKLDWVDVLPHTEEIVPAIAATCTATGLTEGLRCSACGDTLEAQVVTDKLDHKFTVSVEKKDATCTADGYTAHKKCATCDATEGKVEIDTDGHDFGGDYICDKCGTRDGSCEHPKNQVEITVTNATCKDFGTEKFECKVCGYTYENTLSKLTTHSFVNGKCSVCDTTRCTNHQMEEADRVNATCTEDGYVTKTCASCNKVETTALFASHNYVKNICTVCGKGNTASNKITIDLQDVFIVG